MKYTLAKKLHNEDEVTLKQDNNVCKVIEIENNPDFYDATGTKFPHVVLTVIHPKLGWVKVLHNQVK